LKLEISYKAYKLKLSHPFKISRYSRTHQDTVLVTITDGVHYGYGEATTNPYYVKEVSSITDAIDAVLPIVANALDKTPEKLWEALDKTAINRFSLCAIDEAFQDWYGKANGLPNYKRFGFDGAKTPITSYTIGIASIEKMIEKIKEQPWPLYKIKVGFEGDIEMLKALRETTDAVFRVDANCAWTAEETVDKSNALKDLNVEFIEQPLAADDWEGMKYVKANSVLPVIADESCLIEEDVAKCAAYFHGVNIKLMKCGGITPAIRMIAHAKQLGLKTMVGCMTESTVGISAIGQLAPALDYLDADGALLIDNDIANGVSYDFGKLIYPLENGNGVVLK
jgi:L-alanine-DL-glutamate epimerase-like enolase superfamily enzyme